MADSLLVWSEAAGLVSAPEQGSAHAPLLAADSWLLHHGAVRGLDLHASRFATACAEGGGVSAATVAAFWAAAVDQLPFTGTWFPRVELASRPRGRLALRLRSAPPRFQQARVRVSDSVDPRLVPRRKGPDLGVLADWRQAAAAAGADDVLLRTTSGHVVETATSNLLWWADGALCLPSSSLPTLSGVTTRLVQQHARDCGIEVREVCCRLDEFAGRTVWIVNALHGIRYVSAWVGADIPVGPDIDSSLWRAWLARTAQPVRSPAPHPHDHEPLTSLEQR